MGFFQNIKNKLGIGGVSVNLQIPSQVSKASSTIDGKVVLTTKSDQEIVSITVKLIEELTTGRGDDKKTKEYELGRVEIPAGYSIQTGSTKEVPFALPFVVAKSSNQELAEKGGALGALGKMASFAENAKSVYIVKAEADVKSAALDPDDKKEIRLI